MPRGRKGKGPPVVLCACPACLKAVAQHGDKLAWCTQCTGFGTKDTVCPTCGACRPCVLRNGEWAHAICACGVVICYLTQRVPYNGHARTGCQYCHKCMAHCQCLYCTKCHSRLGHYACADCRTCNNCVECVHVQQPGPAPARPAKKQLGRNPQYAVVREDLKGFRQRASTITAIGKDGIPLNDAMVPFHASSKLQFKVNPLRRFLSVEMEIAGLNPGPKEEMFATPLNLDVETLPINLVVERWKGSIVNDVSLPKLGFEINTAPANGDLFVEQVTEICETLRQFGATCTNNYDADKRVLPCGLHTHVDARDLTYNDLQRFLLLYEKVEPALFEMLPGTRRHSHFTIPVGKRYGIMVRAGAPIKPKDREKLGSNPVKTSIIRATYNKKLAARGDKRGCPQETRYGAINIHAWFYRGTIEFRHFYGTVVAREIISWATLVGTLVDFAARSANSTIVGLTDPQLSSGEVLLQIARSSKIELAAFVKHQWAKFKADTDTHESPVLGRNPADDDAARIALEAMRAQVARVPRARPRPRIR